MDKKNVVNKNKLIIYTAPHCMKCLMAEKFCANNDIDAEIKPMTEIVDRTLDMLFESGLQETPILKRGEHWGSGFDIKFLKGEID